MTEKLKTMLASPDKGMSSAEGVLSRLFRQILADNNVGAYAWNNLMERYLNDDRNGIPKNGKDRSSARGNLGKELSRPAMTWKVFRKALQFLGARRIKFTVECEWSNRRRTVHSVNLDLGATDPGDAEEDREENS